MPDRNEVEDALAEALAKFNLAPYVDSLMDDLDMFVEWGESDDEGEDDTGSVVWI